MNITKAYEIIEESIDKIWSIDISHSLYSNCAERRCTINLSTHHKPYPFTEIGLFMYDGRTSMRFVFKESSKTAKERDASDRGLLYDIKGKLFHIIRMEESDREKMIYLFNKIEDKLDLELPNAVWDFL